MRMKLLFFMFGAVLAVWLTAPLLAQESATTSPPVIRSDDTSVILSIRVQNFVPGKDYRIGLGVAGETPAEGTYSLTREGQPVGKQPVAFKQGNTSHWWGVNLLSAKGFQRRGNRAGSGNHPENYPEARRHRRGRQH